MPVARIVRYLAVFFALVILPFDAFAQAPKVPRIGVLATLPASYAAPYVDAGKAALREAGYVEGRNVTIEYRFAERSLERLQAQAAELVALKVDVLVVVGDIAIRTAQKATTTVPIIMVSGGIPTRLPAGSGQIMCSRHAVGCPLTDRRARVYGRAPGDGRRAPRTVATGPPGRRP